jgi:hypothetical protein
VTKEDRVLMAEARESLKRHAPAPVKITRFNADGSTTERIHYPSAGDLTPVGDWGSVRQVEDIAKKNNLLTAAQVCGLVGRSRNSIANDAKNGRLRTALQLSARYQSARLFSKAAVDAYRKLFKNA